MQKLNSEILSVAGKRPNNEDSCMAIQINDASWFMAIADGMGGYAGGELASRTVIKSTSDFIKEQLLNDYEDTDLKDLLKTTFKVAQTSLGDELKQKPELKGMGTTLAAVLVHNGKMVWGNLGDSRIYYLRGEKMQQITSDHSYVQEYLNSGRKEIPESLLTQYDNYVTRVIDGGLDKPDIFPRDSNFKNVQNGDCFLLCSDGLILNKLEDYTSFFAKKIIRSKNLKKAVKRLVAWALKKGSHDNVSIILGQYFSDQAQHAEDDDDYKTIKIDLNKDS